VRRRISDLKIVSNFGIAAYLLIKSGLVSYSNCSPLRSGLEEDDFFEEAAKK